MTRKLLHVLETALAGLTFALPARAEREHEAPCPEREAHTPWYAPDFVKLQTGGWIGFATLGAGYAPFEDAVNFSLFYGYVPARVGGKTIHTVSFQLTFRPARTCFDRRLSWVPFYGGFGALFTRGEGFFLRQPERYESGYYHGPTGARAFLLVGTELQLDGARERDRGHGFYVELSTLDQLLSEWLKNPSTLSFWDTTSLTLGYELRF